MSEICSVHNTEVVFNMFKWPLFFGSLEVGGTSTVLTKVKPTDFN